MRLPRGSDLYGLRSNWFCPESHFVRVSIDSLLVSIILVRFPPGRNVPIRNQSDVKSIVRVLMLTYIQDRAGLTPEILFLPDEHDADVHPDCSDEESVDE